MDTQRKLGRLYDESFYETQLANTIESARIYLKFLWKFLQPASAIDVGCGRGAWLKVCHELGSKTLLGLDGSWNNQSLMIDPDIDFRSIDLNKPFSISEKVDIAITLEVAEHLEPSTASQFIKCMTDASDVVLFSAAYSKQGGPHHINEQPHTYWALLFADYNFVAFDMFRPRFWDNQNVCFWYRQNTFLYVRKGSTSCEQINRHGYEELESIGFMNCIHPELYKMKVAQASIRTHITNIIPGLKRALKRHLG